MAVSIFYYTQLHGIGQPKTAFLFPLFCLFVCLIGWLVGSKQGTCKHIQETTKCQEPLFTGRSIGIPGIQDLVFPSEVILVINISFSFYLKYFKNKDMIN